MKLLHRPMHSMEDLMRLIVTVSNMNMTAVYQRVCQASFTGANYATAPLDAALSLFVCVCMCVIPYFEWD